MKSLQICGCLLVSLFLGACGEIEDPDAVDRTPFDEAAPEVVGEPKPNRRVGVMEATLDEVVQFLESERSKTEGTVILDIRTPEEFAEGHLPGAINLDSQSDTFADEVAKLDKKVTYVMHCQSGGRSGRAKGTFEEQQFHKVMHMADGYSGWLKAGHPVAGKE